MGAVHLIEVLRQKIIHLVFLFEHSIVKEHFSFVIQFLKYIFWGIVVARTSGRREAVNFYDFQRLKLKNSKLWVQLAEWSLPTPQTRGSNPVLGNFLFAVYCIEKTK